MPHPSQSKMPPFQHILSFTFPQNFLIFLQCLSPHSPLVTFEEKASSRGWRCFSWLLTPLWPLVYSETQKLMFALNDDDDEDDDDDDDVNDRDEA